jgi:hypothetical protein
MSDKSKGLIDETIKAAIKQVAQKNKAASPFPGSAKTNPEELARAALEILLRARPPAPAGWGEPVLELEERAMAVAPERPFGQGRALRSLGPCGLVVGKQEIIDALRRSALSGGTVTSPSAWALARRLELEGSGE